MGGSAFNLQHDGGHGRKGGDGGKCLRFLLEFYIQQAQFGRFSIACKTQPHAATPLERAFIEGTEIAKQQLIHSDPTKALPPEIERDDVANKIDTLADVAKSRTDAEDQAGAMIVLDRAWALREAPHRCSGVGRPSIASDRDALPRPWGAGQGNVGGEENTKP